uniref:Uncharacterized protein n=1 Tax=Micrurus corallinus TaxID=54390 RepID=A0A2D4GLM1_MICCO
MGPNWTIMPGYPYGEETQKNGTENKENIPASFLSIHPWYCSIRAERLRDHPFSTAQSLLVLRRKDERRRIEDLNQCFPTLATLRCCGLQLPKFFSQHVCKQ